MDPVGERWGNMNMFTDCWVILRCKPSHTLLLESTLLEWDVVAWTPKVNVKARRAHTRRAKTSLMPVMPSFVFVKEKEWPRLQPIKEQLGELTFNVFVFYGIVPRVHDKELEPLRSYQEETLDENRPQEFSFGERCVVGAGPFVGTEVVVCGYNRAYYTVEAVESRMKLKIPALLLVANNGQDKHMRLNTASQSAR